MDSTEAAPIQSSRRLAEKLLDEHRPQMVECLAAAIFGDWSGSVDFGYHFQNGVFQIAKARSEHNLT